jgi:hypothetical protein
VSRAKTPSVRHGVRLAESEIGQFRRRLFLVRQQNVCRLDVAVENTVAVRLGQPARDRPHKVGGFQRWPFHRRRQNPLLERPALDQLEHQERKRFVVEGDVLVADDVRWSPSVALIWKSAAASRFSHSRPPSVVKNLTARAWGKYA